MTPTHSSAHPQVAPATDEAAKHAVANGGLSVDKIDVEVDEEEEEEEADD